MSDPSNRTTDYAERLLRAEDRLRQAESYVRDALRLMGQHEDAEDAAMVRETAHRVLRTLYGRRLPQ